MPADNATAKAPDASNSNLERALQASEERYRLLAEGLAETAERLRLALDAAQLGDWKWDAATDRVSLSARAAEIFCCNLGLNPTRSELRAQMHPEDGDRVRALADQALETRTEYEVECRILDADGSSRWAMIKGRPHYTAAGEPLGLLGVVQDITAQKRTADEVRDKEARYRRIFESAAVSIWDEDFSLVKQALDELRRNGVEDFRAWLEANPDFVAAAIKMVRVRDVNLPSVGLFEAADKAELMDHFGSIFLPEAVAVFREELIAIAEGRTHFEAETPLQTLRGHRIDVILTMTFSADDPALCHVPVSVTDITTRKKVERALVQQAQDLTRTNTDLRQFAYAVSHDLQEPVRMVSIYGQLVRERYGSQLDAEGLEYLDFAVNGALRIDALLQDLLDYTRVGSQIGNEPTVSDSTVALHKVLSNLHIEIRREEVRVVTGTLPRVKAHEVHLIQLFQNLIINSIKYRGDAPPVVEIGAERRDGWWEFRVRDNGMGIDPQYHARIFGLFKRLHGQNIPGTGIGLAICSRVVELYGGAIWVESEAGHGATFRFTLPAD